MIGFQNATHLNRELANVEFFYNLGIRQMQLTYNSLNALGAGCTRIAGPSATIRAARPMSTEPRPPRKALLLYPDGEG